MMATVDGDVKEVGSYGDGLLSGFSGNSSPLPTGSGVPTAKFRMRGWKIGVGWQAWTTYGTPDTDPPVGLGPVVDVTQSAFWE